MISFLKFATVCSIAVASIAFLPQRQSEETKETQEKDQTTLLVQDPDAISRRDFMRTKLMYSQNILEGLTTGDFNAIEKAIKEVQTITEAEQWVQIDTDPYRKYTQEFKTSANRLMDAAKTKNIDATALRFYDMSTRCIDCHKHIRKAGYRM